MVLVFALKLRVFPEAYASIEIGRLCNRLAIEYLITLNLNCRHQDNRTPTLSCMEIPKNPNIAQGNPFARVIGFVGQCRNYFLFYLIINTYFILINFARQTAVISCKQGKSNCKWPSLGAYHLTPRKRSWGNISLYPSLAALCSIHPVILYFKDLFLGLVAYSST